MCLCFWDAEEKCELVPALKALVEQTYELNDGTPRRPRRAQLRRHLHLAAARLADACLRHRRRLASQIRARVRLDRHAVDRRASGHAARGLRFAVRTNSPHLTWLHLTARASNPNEPERELKLNRNYTRLPKVYIHSKILVSLVFRVRISMETNFCLLKLLNTAAYFWAVLTTLLRYWYGKEYSFLKVGSVQKLGSFLGLCHSSFECKGGTINSLASQNQGFIWVI